jgi:hypothetical protein
MNNKTSTNKESWTTEQLISLSTNLGHAYGGVTPTTKSDREEKTPAEELINLSQILGQAYGPSI